MFYIGDGLTGSGNGQPQIFVVPPSATRLFLGFVDTASDGGTPGGYGDNSGALSARASVEDNAITDLTGPALTALSFAGAPLNAGQTLTRSGTLSVAAVDPSGVARVEFLIDGALAGTDANGNDGYSLPLNLYALTDGAHALAVRAFDTLGNATELSRNVTVALAAPCGAVDRDARLRLEHGQQDCARHGHRGDRRARTALHQRCGERQRARGRLGRRVQRYGVAGRRCEPLAGGSAESRRHQRAERRGAGHRRRQHPRRAARSVGRRAAERRRAPRPGSARATGSVKGYHVYRAAGPFTDPAQAGRVNTALVTATSFDDLPPADGAYFYRVVAVNAVDTASMPSNQASAVADRTPPRALAIEYRPGGPFDSASGRFGRGNVELTLRVSEPLPPRRSSASPRPAADRSPSSSPASPTPSTAAPSTSPSTRPREPPTRCSPRAMRSATAAPRSLPGGSLLIDAAGPALTALTVTPAEPIKNDRASPAALVVDFALSEAMKPGEMPQLSYLLSGAGRTPVAIGDVSATGPTSYRATFPLARRCRPRRRRVAELRLRRPGRSRQHLLAHPRRESLPGLPGRAAAGGRADRPRPPTPLPGGKVELTWNAAEDAAAYQLYRQAPGETELSPYQRLLDPGYLDATSSDGMHRYAVASIRAHNDQESLSARSATVEAMADATRPDAPRDLLLGLTGAGIVALWKAPAATDVTGFNVYRSSAAAITSVEGLTPLRAKVQALSFVDAAPSANEHSYVVTALDAAGNESPISNSAYLNAALLPVNTLKVVQTGDALPVLSWTHPTGAVAGYDVYVGPDSARVKLNPTCSPCRPSPTAATPETSAATAWSRWTATRRRSLAPSPCRDCSSSRSAACRCAAASSTASTTSSATWAAQRSRTRGCTIALGTHSHLSQPFFLNAGETKVVSVVVGGYPDLEATTPLTTTIEISPNEGERVEIARAADAQVADGSLTLSVQSESLTRGNTGKVRFTLSNSSAVETQVVTARALGQQPSDEIRVRLADRDGNVLVSQPFIQIDGGVETYSSGVTVARLAPGASFTSAPVDVPVPSAAPDDISVLLDIDQLHYRIGEPEQAALPGLSEQPERTPAGQRLLRAGDRHRSAGLLWRQQHRRFAAARLERRSAQPLSSVPVKLILAVDGFERALDLFSDASGNFALHLRAAEDATPAGSWCRRSIPTASSARTRGISSSAASAPARRRSRCARCATSRSAWASRVVAGAGSSATNLRLLVDAADQPTGTLPRGVKVDAPAPLSLAAGERRTLDILGHRRQHLGGHRRAGAAPGLRRARRRSARVDSNRLPLLRRGQQRAGRVRLALPDARRTSKRARPATARSPSRSRSRTRGWAPRRTSRSR